MKRLIPTLLLTSVFAAATVGARGIHAENAWARFTPPGVQTGAVYVSLHNDDARGDALVGVRTPLAERSEIHENQEKDGMMQMRALPQGLALPPKQTVQLQPGGHHIMLMGLKKPLAAGSSLPVTLIFRHAKPMTLTVPVLKNAGEPQDSGHAMHDHSGMHKH